MAEPRKNILNLPPQLSTSSRARISLVLSVLCVSCLYYYFGYSFNPQNFLRTRHHDVFLSSATNYTLSSYLRALTLHPHLAGTKPSLQTSLYVENHFRELGLDTRVKEYNVLLSYPKHSSLSAHFSNGVVREFSLTDYEGEEGVVRPYHAYSPSGTAYGEVVFVNYGREEDYRALGAGVKVKGSIVLVRRGSGSQARGVVVNNAAERGAVAVLMYTVGAEDRGVERGTVMVNSLGDPLSPGWGAAEGVGIESERLGSWGWRMMSWRNGFLKYKIPSLPISANVAHEILGYLLKEGNRNKVPLEWRGTLRVQAVPVGIWSGPVMFNFSYQGEKKMETIRNVFAVVKGLEEPDRFVVLGNHRDAWTYGAVDPNSGTAALLDIARRYALMMRMGWNPRRTIIISSWDAEEFGMIGSTEWVEENLLNLGSKAVAYLNVDCAVQGPGFFAGSTPQLDDLLVEITKKVKDPDTVDMTINEKWITNDMGINIQRLSGVDSDFAPFLQLAGIPSVDLYYGKDFPVYHTAFDSYGWMTKYGDPFFQRHVAVAGVWGLLALHLSDDPVLPFNYLSYAGQLQEYTDVLSDIVGGDISLHPLSVSIKKFVTVARETQKEAQNLREQKTMSELQVLERRRLNDRLMLAERGFIDTDGLQGRTWFKHLIYGPPGNNKSKLDFFPGIAEALSRSSSMSKNQSRAEIQHEVWRVARAIQRAASALKGEVI